MRIAGSGHLQAIYDQSRTQYGDGARYPIARDNWKPYPLEGYVSLIYQERLMICPAEDLYDPSGADKI